MLLRGAPNRRQHRDWGTPCSNYQCETPLREPGDRCRLPFAVRGLLGLVPWHPAADGEENRAGFDSVTRTWHIHPLRTHSLVPRRWRCLWRRWLIWEPCRGLSDDLIRLSAPGSPGRMENIGKRRLKAGRASRTLSTRADVGRYWDRDSYVHAPRRFGLLTGQFHLDHPEWLDDTECCRRVFPQADPYSKTTIDRSLQAADAFETAQANTCLGPHRSSESSTAMRELANSQSSTSSDQQAYPAPNSGHLAVQPSEIYEPRQNARSPSLPGLDLSAELLTGAENRTAR